MATDKVQHLKPGSRKQDDTAAEDRARFEMYQAFMIGYVRRINEASFNVTIGGVRIGSAKYSRLAQINLQSRIITFSRFAVENVPERGRRYLVLHELAHVKEANHNKKFWGHVERYEPNYRAVSRELEVAFKNNVRDEHQRLKKMSFSNSLAKSSHKDARSQAGNRLMNYKLEVQGKNTLDGVSNQNGVIINPYNSNNLNSLNISSNSSKSGKLSNSSDSSSENFDCMEEEFSLWDFDEPDGIVNGGSDSDAYRDEDAESQSSFLSNSGSSTVITPNSDFVQLKLPFG
jgi:Protein of unknown function DUF45